MLCISGFMDDVTFSRNGRAARKVGSTQRQRSIACATEAESDVYECLFSLLCQNANYFEASKTRQVCATIRSQSRDFDSGLLTRPAMSRPRQPKVHVKPNDEMLQIIFIIYILL